MSGICAPARASMDRDLVGWTTAGGQKAKRCEPDFCRNDAGTLIDHHVQGDVSADRSFPMLSRRLARAAPPVVAL
jgi:hypothetical protein